MNVVKTQIPEVLIFEPKVFGDARGFFFESFNAKVFQEATGLDVQFVQDNHSKSAQGVLRGLHYPVSYTHLLRAAGVYAATRLQHRGRQCLHAQKRVQNHARSRTGLSLIHI